MKEEGLFLSTCFQAVGLSHTVLASAQNDPVVPGVRTLTLPRLGAEVDVGCVTFFSSDVFSDSHHLPSSRTSCRFLVGLSCFNLMNPRFIKNSSFFFGGGGNIGHMILELSQE